MVGGIQSFEMASQRVPFAKCTGLLAAFARRRPRWRQEFLLGHFYGREASRRCSKETRSVVKSRCSLFIAAESRSRKFAELAPPSWFHAASRDSALKADHKSRGKRKHSRSGVLVGLFLLAGPLIEISELIFVSDSLSAECARAAHAWCPARPLDGAEGKKRAKMGSPFECSARGGKSKLPLGVPARLPLATARRHPDGQGGPCVCG